jgi:hypothetical protein
MSFTLKIRILVKIMDYCILMLKWLSKKINPLQYLLAYLLLKNA